MSPQGYIRYASFSNDILLGSVSSDLLFYTANNTQNLLFGLGSNTYPILKISSNNITINNSNFIITNLLKGDNTSIILKDSNINLYSVLNSSNVFINNSNSSNIFNSTVSFNSVIINSNLTVSGITTITSNLTLNSSLVLTSNLVAGSNIILGSNSLNLLTVNGTPIFYENVIINSLKSLTVSGQTTINSNLTVLGITTLNSNLTTYNNVVIGSNSSNIATINANTTFNENINLASNAILTVNNVILQNNLTASNNVNINSNLTINGNIILGSNINSIITFNSPTSFSNDIYISTFKNLTVSGLTTFTTPITVYGSTILNNDLIINSNLTTTIGTANTLYVLGTSTFNENVSLVSKGLTTNSSTITTIGGNLIVNGTTTINNTLSMLKNVTFSNNLVVNSPITFNNNLTVNSTFPMVPYTNSIYEFNNNLFVSNGLCMNPDVKEGSTRGFYLWNNLDPNWGIYIASAGATKSLANGTACTSPLFSTWAMRHRTWGGGAMDGFIFENDNEEWLFGIGSTGYGLFSIKGETTINNTLTITNPTEQYTKIGSNLVVSGGIYTASAYQCRVGSSGAFQANGFNLYWNSPSLQFYIDSSLIGTISFSSDYRLKQNIKPFNLGINLIKKIQPVLFNFKNNIENIIQHGLIAHEVQKIIPDAVSGQKDAIDNEGNLIYQNLLILPFISVLIKGIQELDENYKCKQSVDIQKIGYINITNFNGNIQNGDYIVQSIIPYESDSTIYYGQLQESNKLYNNTIAKSIEKINWDLITDMIFYNNKYYKKTRIACIFI